MKILHYILFCFCGITVNSLQETTTQIQTNSDNLYLTVSIPMIVVTIIIIIILIGCYYIFRHPWEYERISDVNSEEAHSSNETASNSEERNANEGYFSSQKRSSSQLKESPQFKKENQNKKPLINLQDEIEPNNLNLVGLPNEKNECYMNCVFQSLASSEYFIKQIKEIREKIPDSLLSKNIIELIDGLNNTRGSANLEKNSKHLKIIINLINWTKEQQQDAFAFLCALINNIHNEMKGKEMEMEPPLKIELLHKISGLPVQNKIQYHIGLSVGLCGEYKSAPGVKIEFLIDEYFSVSNIDEDSTKTTQLMFSKNTPQLLLIHIQANKWDTVLGELKKPTYFIQYKRDLLIYLPVHGKENDEKKKTKYKLVAVVEHMGYLDKGHFITYRKLEKVWLLANDTQVEERLFKENSSPYILFYEKD